jgi:serine/threonine protein kinase
VGCIKGKSLFVTREANDWDTSHLYNQAISRQKTVHDGDILAKLKDNPHPHICRVVDFNDKWVELEYIPGKLLSNRCRWLPEVQVNQSDHLDDGVSAGECITLIEQISDALSFLHNIGVCHTDLNPFNIMIDNEGNAKIIDIIGCMPKSDELIKLDWEVFTRYTVREVVERCRYNVLNEPIDVNKNLGFKDLLEKVETYEREVGEREQQLHSIINSRGWRLLEKLRRVRDVNKGLMQRLRGARKRQ